MTVTIEYATKHLDELLETVDGGGSVEIVRPDKPSVRLTGEPLTAVADTRAKRVLGAGRGELRTVSDEEWELMDKEWRKSFEDKFSSDAA
ncbi:MAG: hypothetical protein V4555_18750 [Acidobacteriota bacterium]